MKSFKHLDIILGSFANAIVMARMKVATGGRWLAARTIGSTIIGEFFDAIVFCLAAFLGALPNDAETNLNPFAA